MRMRRWLQVEWFAAVIIVALATIIIWRVRHDQNAFFRGKRESDWVKEIVYNGDTQQTEQWRSFGLEGVRMLGRALDEGRLYRRIYRGLAYRCNGLFWKYFPAPADTYRTQLGAAYVLDMLGQDAKGAEPAIARALKDEAVGVRLEALACYLHLLGQMDQGTKRRRLPGFLRAMHDKEAGIRNNAAMVLKFYPEQADLVVPVLVVALEDPVPCVRIQAGESLVRVKPAERARALAAVLPLTTNQDSQVAIQAKGALHRLGGVPRERK
jgi:hypothetical protein